MFTGIVEAVGRIAAIERIGGDVRLTVAEPGGYLDGAALGDSIAVNGVCLTAVAFVPQAFVADLSAETLGATTAGGWRDGQAVNLEKALTAGKPLGGHWVSGHVDGVARLVSEADEARGWRLRLAVPRELSRFVARKGSVTLDGVSLTVNEVDGDEFGVMIVPHTREHTALGGLKAGARVNFEVDLIARYLERLLAAREG